MGLNFDETAVAKMERFISESRNYFNNGRTDCDIYRRGLRDGCRLEIEQDKMQRMKMEKEEEEKTGKRRGDIKTEWDHDFRLKLKKELREELKLECNRLSEKIEEERKEMKIFMEEMKEIKDLKLKIEDEIREKETIKVKSLCEEIGKERETYLEELKEMKEVMKYEIENLKKLRREKDEVESEREIDEFYKLKEILK